MDFLVCFIIHLHLSLYCLSNHTNSLVKLDFENIILTILKNVENTLETQSPFIDLKSIQDISNAQTLSAKKTDHDS